MFRLLYQIIKCYVFLQSKKFTINENIRFCFVSNIVPGNRDGTAAHCGARSATGAHGLHLLLNEMRLEHLNKQILYCSKKCCIMISLTVISEMPDRMWVTFACFVVVDVVVVFLAILLAFLSSVF